MASAQILLAMLLTLHVPIAFAFGMLSVHPCEKGAAGAQHVITMCSAAPGPAVCTSVGPPSTAIFAAEDGSGGVDGPYSLVMISLFRLAFGHALGYQSPRALSDYEGLVELARRLYTSLPGDDEREKCVGDLFRAFPSHPQLLQVSPFTPSAPPGKKKIPAEEVWNLLPPTSHLPPPTSHLPPSASQDNRLSAELLGMLTSTLFPFLVGPCHVEQWDRTARTETDPPEQWRSKVVIERWLTCVITTHSFDTHPFTHFMLGCLSSAAPSLKCRSAMTYIHVHAYISKVVIERCRFLEASQCKGMCLGLCKRPSEAYFTERGLPLSMTPNFEDGSCEMVWGRTPQDEDMDGANLACFGDCALLRGRHGERQA